MKLSQEFKNKIAEAGYTILLTEDKISILKDERIILSRLTEPAAFSTKVAMKAMGINPDEVIESIILANLNLNE